MNLYQKLMAFLAVPMTPIKAYSLKHLLVAVIVIGLAWVLALLFSKSKMKKQSVLTFWGIILLVSEIIKQCLLTYVRQGSYSWTDFPFQLCSIPMYLCLIYSALKKGQDVIDHFLLSFGFICGITALIVPGDSFYGYWVLTIQSLLWHGVLLFLFFYLLRVNRNARAVKSYLPVLLLYAGLAAVAIVINYLTRKVSGGTTNMFFLGPNDPNMYILSTIYSVYGWIIESVIMVILTGAAGFVSYMVSGARKK